MSVADGVGVSVTVAVLVAVAVGVGVRVIVDVEVAVGGSTENVGEAFKEGIVAPHPALRIATMPHQTGSRSLPSVLKQQEVLSKEGVPPADPTAIVPR
jgi:hypothetical protein